MRFIHCADIHLGIGKYGKVDINTGLNSRIQEDLEQLDKIINYAIKIKCELFMIAGDIFDKRKPDEIIQREFAKRLKTLIDNRITTIALIGNHEGTTAVDTAHCLSSIKVLAGSKYLHIVDDARVIDINNISIACMPYYNNEENLLSKNPNILLGHLEISGAKNGNYMFSGGVSPMIFENSKLKYIALGHIHQYQKIGRAVYSGSINRINFGDEGIQKGFIKGDITCTGCKWKFIKLKARKFLTINGTWGYGVKKLIRKYNVMGKIVKVNITDKKGCSVIPVLPIKDYLQSHGAIVDSVNVLREVKVKVRDKQYKHRKSPMQMLERYLKGEKESVIKRGVKILIEAIR